MAKEAEENSARQVAALEKSIADLLAKLPAGGDWLIADALGEHPITHREWDLIQKPLRGWLADPHDCAYVTVAN